MVTSTSKALNQLNFFSFRFVLIDGLSLPSFCFEFCTNLSPPTRCWQNFASTLDAGKGRCSQNLLKRACSATGYSHEMGNRVGTFNAIKDSRLA
jgi:hypothetical protein